MNEEVKDLIEDVEKIEKKDHEEQAKILEKLTNAKIEDKRVKIKKFQNFKNFRLMP